MKGNTYVPIGNHEKVLMHICCAPDASYPFLYLKGRHYDVTGFFYGPNIHPLREYELRLNEACKLAQIVGMPLIEGEYNINKWFELTKGLENEKEGEKRCYLCYEERLDVTAKLARGKGFDYFTTTISISPHKNSEWVFEISKRLEEKYGVRFLQVDFKKHDGFKYSIVLSKFYGLYRQDYCGCTYSKIEADAYRKSKNS